jgi:hypothetical protein
MNMGTTQPQIPGFDPSSVGSVTFLPLKPVNIGDTWTSSVPLTMLGLTLNNKMTLMSVQTVGASTIARIQTTTSSTPLAPTAGQATPIAAMGTVTGDGFSDFDIGAGAIKSTTMNTRMSMSMPSGNDGQMKMTMDMKMKMTRLN